MTRNEVKKRDKNSDSKVASLDGGDVKPLATMGKVANNSRKKDVKFIGGGKIGSWGRIKQLRVRAREQGMEKENRLNAKVREKSMLIRPLISYC